MAQTIKFICLNVWNGGKLWKPMVEFLKKENPDILMLQEVFESQKEDAAIHERTIESLQKEIDLPYSAFAPAFLNTHAGNELEKGNAVLSRFPLTPQPTLFYDAPYAPTDDSGLPGQDYTQIPRNLQHVTTQVGETLLHIFNTQGIWGFDGKDNPRRNAMRQTMSQAITGLDHVILAGDFNVDEKSGTMKKFREKMTDIFLGERTTSFNMLQKSDGGYGTAIVDFIFVSPDVQVISHSSPQINISDHLPLIMVLTSGSNRLN